MNTARKSSRRPRPKNKTPQAYCDELAADWQAFAKKLELTNDDFVRTTQPRHKEFVQADLAKLHGRRPFLQSNLHGILFGQEETFLTEKDRLPDGTFDPALGRSDRTARRKIIFSS